MANPTHEGKSTVCQLYIFFVQTFSSLFLDIEQQMKAVQAERKKLNVTQGRDTVSMACLVLIWWARGA